MTPAEVLRGVADALDRGEIDLRMSHPGDAPEPFQFLGGGSDFLGEKDNVRYYRVPVERVLGHMKNYIRKLRLDGENEQAETSRIARLNDGKIIVQ